ncbi:MAG: RnfABCDGE type electron transport complex subunit C, partial [Clostridia bacterium]|nr:RnfABCDGE type electron transport complex subunit C [Clostridia bacterium]
MSIRKGKNYPYGIHVKDMKYLTENLAIETMPTPDKVFISMSQHIGAPAIPIVAVGDKVKKGQLIGEASGAISANVFSSVSGTVTEITDIVNGMGQKQKYVVIENDGQNEEVFFDEMSSFEPKDLVERIRLAGIVGLGGAGFPTAVKLSPKTQLDALIINGAECEPYLNCDYRLMLERTEDIYRGIKYTAMALNISKIIIGIEANKPQAIKLFSEYKDLDVVVLKKQYPMGSEKHLIYCTTGRKVPCGKMPFDVGVCVQNIKTMIAVYEAIENNIRKKVVQKIVINPAYYSKMSEVLEQLILDRKRGVIAYKQLLQRYLELAKNISNPEDNNHYPESIRKSGAMRAFYDNCGEDEQLAIR